MSEEDSETAIHYATYTGKKEAVQLLLSCGVDIDTRSSHGATPLHKALARGWEDIVETLLEAGADANSALLYGRTPLHFAAALGQTQVTTSLLRSGADPTVRNVFRSFPFEVALRYGHESIVEMLRPTHINLNTSEGHRQWLLQFDDDEKCAPFGMGNATISRQAAWEWHAFPVRSRMLQDIAAEKGREKGDLNDFPHI